tara:strand:+ start:920 stop:2251 length:1332 start_codon:yes stop_codon:yes gene_type:complete
MSSRYIEIVPTNIPSTGKISFKNGHPIIQFVMGASDHLLLGSSIRLTGDFQCFLNRDVAGVPQPPTADGRLTMDNTVGAIFSTWDQVVIKNLGQYSTLEHIKNYNRMMASYMPVTSSNQDTIGHFGETALTMPNYNLMKTSVVENSGDVNANNFTTNSFSTHIPCGLFLGQQPIFIGEQGVNGIVIEIHLSPDNMAFFDENSAADNSAIHDAFYEYSNLKLTAELIEPDAATLQTLKGKAGNTYQYNSISSYYTSINSALSVINFNLGLRNVLGVWMNFIEANRINNWRYNSLSTRLIHNSTNNRAPIRNLVFTRGGVKFPNNYDTVTLQQDNPTDNFADPSIVSGYIDAITQFAKMGRTMVSPLTTFENDLATDNLHMEGSQFAGVGIAYDHVSGQGVDFSNQNWGIQMNTDLTTNNPLGVYLFVHSKQTMVFNGSGVQVLK